AIAPCVNLLDECAAPGGKSVLLSEKCKHVTACEIHPHRLALIEAYKSRMGAENVTARLADSTVFIPEYEGAFDAVLCDAPCSGTGVINENPDIKLFRKEEDVASLSDIQLKILSNCSRYVKSGGRLYYSTCSVLPEENDSTVYNFLNSAKGFTVEETYSPLEHRKTKFGLQFLPHISMGAGFYLAAFIKD
ncbi:MAG: 16S rRNA (cytosine(967)-C(5))-methyltransferase RsmB, partial [Clostridia bacterium]|nr:16S rRNA (cytosine(967)-C(5))-methyltransferase RsmB [Clostridia bacterium]